MGKIICNGLIHINVYTGKEKDDYITELGTKTTASTYKKWIAENNMVMSWLVNSMTTDIGENFLSFDTAKEIWDIAKETFSDKENTSEIIQIEGILHDLRQGNLTVTEYFNTLTRLWRQLDTFEVHNWNCVTDGFLYKKIVEGKRVFKFLLGLNKNLDEIRGRIMGVKPLPSLREAFSEVRREERGRPWCDHCENWKPRQPLEKEGRGNHVATDEQSPQPEASPFNKEQMEMLQKLLSPLLSVQSQTGSSSNQVIGSETLAHKGNFLSAFTAGKKRKKPWIVDSGASDHMTGDATIFDTYSSCPNNLTVRIADGSLSKVAGTGSVVLSRDLTLNSVLLIPNLGNLLSISKLTKEKRCLTNFSSTHREFQDLDSGRRLAMPRNALDSTSLRSATIHKNNLKWRLVVILFGFMRISSTRRIVHLSSCVDTPQQNGIVKGKIVVLTAAYLINRMPPRVLKFQTPCQTLLKSFPTTRLISTVPPKIFGCSVFVHINQQHRSKLDPRSLKCIFLGYYSNQKGISGENSTQEYQFWDLESFRSHPSPLKITFLQSHLISPSPLLTCGIRSTSKRKRRKEHFLNKPMRQNRVLIQANFQLENDILNMPIAWRKGVRSCTQHPIGNFISYDKLSPTFRAFTSSITEIQVPQNIRKLSTTGKEWCVEITDLPRGKKPVGCKWIFTVKYKADGNVDRYKARLVAKGFTQSYGIDYQETFAPVAKLNTVRVLLSLAANLDWSLHQLDVKNAFLNGDLEEEVYMDIPAGLETTSNFNKVCRLRKSLYGLKQSPRAWFERFTKVVKGYGFVQCQSDHTLFVKHFPEGKLAIIIVYVDDIILTGDHEEKIDLLKKLLTKEFEIKDLGNLKYFLGMEIARSKKGIAVSQRKYVLDLLNETGMLGCKPAETPMDTTVKLEESDGSAPVDKGRYQRLVGKLIYLSHTRPDIGFSVSVVSQFMNNPTEKHMTAVIRILRYLKMTPGKDFSDADWAGSVTDRRSTSGYCSFVSGNLVTWRMLEKLRVPLKHPMVLYRDNQHVEIDRHFIKEKIEEGVFKVSYTPTNCQTADILTKALARVNFKIR
ncbi:hypothetical protein AAG906_031238 [Vitis piasezkii]